MPAEEELRRAIERLTTTVDQLRAELVRKDVYESNERSRDRQMRDMEKDFEALHRTVERNENRRTTDRKADEDKQAANRRMILVALIFPLVLILLQLYLAARVGAPS